MGYECSKCYNVWESATDAAACCGATANVRPRGRPKIPLKPHPKPSVAIITPKVAVPSAAPQVAESVAAVSTQGGGSVVSSPASVAAFVPAVNGYVPRKFPGGTDIEIFRKAYGARIPTLIVGHTGTGKTHAVRDFAFTNKLPYMRVNLNEATTVEDLVGQFVADGGGFRWVDGVLTKFIREGGVFVVDEINAANAGILFVLHSVLDDERKIVLVQKDGEVVHAHKDFWLVATMNPEGYEGVRPLNDALKDRFGVIMEYGYDESVEEKLIENKRLLRLAKNLRGLFEKGEIVTPCSTRMLLQYVQNESLFGTPFAVSCFVAKFKDEERKAVSNAADLFLVKPDVAVKGAN